MNIFIWRLLMRRSSSVLSSSQDDGAPLPFRIFLPWSKPQYSWRGLEWGPVNSDFCFSAQLILHHDRLDQPPHYCRWGSGPLYHSIAQEKDFQLPELGLREKKKNLQHRGNQLRTSLSLRWAATPVPMKDRVWRHHQNHIICRKQTRDSEVTKPDPFLWGFIHEQPDERAWAVL